MEAPHGTWVCFWGPGRSKWKKASQFSGLGESLHVETNLFGYTTPFAATIFRTTIDWNAGNLNIPTPCCLDISGSMWVEGNI